MIVKSENKITEASSQDVEQNRTLNVNGKISNKGIEVHSEYEKNNNIKNSSAEEEMKQFSSLLLRNFSIKEYMEKIITELESLGIRKVHTSFC